VFTTEALGVCGTGRTKWAADCDWTQKMDQRHHRAAGRLGLASHAGTGSHNSVSDAPAAPKLEWWDDTTIWESGVLRRATPEELAGRYN
jgi:hypothetical protein